MSDAYPPIRQRCFVTFRSGDGAAMARHKDNIPVLHRAAVRRKHDGVQVVAGIVLCLCALAPSEAYAYLDPGTGTFALQGLIAGVAGGVISIRAYWRRIGRLFRRSKTGSDSRPERPPGGDA